MPAVLSNASVGGVGTGLTFAKQLAPFYATLLYNNDTATNGFSNIRVTSAGKTYFLVAATLKFHATVDNAQAELYVYTTGNTLIAFNSAITATYKTTDAGERTVTFPHPIPVPAGVNIGVLSSNAGLKADASLIGWEE